MFALGSIKVISRVSTVLSRVNASICCGFEETGDLSSVGVLDHPFEKGEGYCLESIHYLHQTLVCCDSFETMN